MSQSKQTPRNFGALALALHALLVMVPFTLLVMYVPVILGGASGEGAGMGVFLLLYFLGIPMVLIAVAATVLSMHSPKPGLLLPTVLLWLGVVVVGGSESSQAIVLFSIAYIAAVLRAMFLRFRVRGKVDA
jgi:hypothetical protein